jgi:hypothetical protein
LFSQLLESLAVVFLGTVTTREALSAGQIEVTHGRAEFGRTLSASTGAFACAQLPWFGISREPNSQKSGRIFSIPKKRTPGFAGVAVAV